MRQYRADCAALPPLSLALNIHSRVRERHPMRSCETSGARPPLHPESEEDQWKEVIPRVLEAAPPPAEEDKVGEEDEEKAPVAADRRAKMSSAPKGIESGLAVLSSSSREIKTRIRSEGW